MAKAQYRHYPKLGLKGGCCHPWLGLKVVVICSHYSRLGLKVVVIHSQESRLLLSGAQGCPYLWPGLKVGFIHDWG
jgi:hypothetical protein